MDKRIRIIRWYTYNASLLRVLEGLDLELSIKAKNSNINPMIASTVIAYKSEIDLKDDGDDLDFWFKTEE